MDMEDLKYSIIKALLYFDIFSFPLRQEEAHCFCGVKAEPDEIKQALNELTAEELAWEFDGYFMAQPRAEWVAIREENFKISTALMDDAGRNARLISQFPFVRAVAISGSLSKYSADLDADIDFFIITRSGRLWICRSILHLFKKLTFLFGRQNGFCMNYFLDEEELELKDKNYYTALESITVIPMFGASTQRAFYEANAWLKACFPNWNPLQKLEAPILEEHSLLKLCIERFFSGRWGAALDHALRRLTIWWWRNKLRLHGFPMQYFDHDFRATKGESKNHPNDHQRLILAAFRRRIQAYEERSQHSGGCL